MRIRRSAPIRTPFIFPRSSSRVTSERSKLISNTSYYRRGGDRLRRHALQSRLLSDATDLGGSNQGDVAVFPTPFQAGCPFPLLDGSGTASAGRAISNYRAPASVDNDQHNFTQEVRLQSADPTAPLIWTTGIFFASDRQQYLEQIHDPVAQ